MKLKTCELCSEKATIYCDSDHAFLCWTCDENVHSANFLVARHLRQPLCSNCDSFAGDLISGVGIRFSVRSPICRYCWPEMNDSFSGEGESEDSDDSVCVSSNESKLESSVRLRTVMKKKKIKKSVNSRVCSSSSETEISGVESDSPVRSSKKKQSGNDQNRPSSLTQFDAKAEGIFVNWCRDLGLKIGDSSTERVVSTASHALRKCVETSARVLPSRVFLAASFWYGLRGIFVFKNNSARGSHFLKRIEQVSGVPAKLILTVGSKLERESRDQISRHSDLVEGSAEC